MAVGGRQTTVSLALVALLLAPSIVTVAAPAPPNAQPKLVGGELMVYPMDATDHNQPSSGRTQDVSGNDRHATLNGVVQVTGMHGEAYRFDSSGDYIALPDSPTSDQPDGTFMLWINRDAAGGILVLKVLPGSTTELVAGVSSGGSLGFRTAQNQGSPTLSSSTLVPEGVWTHVAFTWGPQGKRIYVDGRLDASDTNTAGVGSQSTVTYLGNDPNAPRYAYRGAMDDVRFYDRALSEDEVQDVRLLPYGSATPTGLRDQDGDGLDDAVEGQHGTDPRRADSDLDGLNDFQEVVTYGTDARKADTDGDGLRDGDELFRVGSDPKVADTDGDGLRDDSDSTPTHESKPPTYPAGETFLVLFEEGYIDLVIDDPGAHVTPPGARVPCIRNCPLPEEIEIDPGVRPGEARVDATDIVSVVVGGNLTVETAEGPLAQPLVFSMFARRGEGATWSARYPIPPGVTRVTREDLSLVVVDRSGNAWSASQSFSHVLEGNEWRETYAPIANSTGWEFILEHASDATIANSQGRFAAYRVVPDGPDGKLRFDVATQQTPLHSVPPGIITIKAGARWDRVTINMDPRDSIFNRAFAMYTEAMATPEGQSAEMALGMTAVGGATECPRLFSPDTPPQSLDQLIALAGCIDFASTFGGPLTKVGGRAANAIAREVAKLARHADEPGARAIGKMQLTWAERGLGCPNLNTASVFVLNQPARIRTISLTDRAFTPATAYDYANTELRLLLTDDVIGDLRLTRTEDEIVDTLRTMHQPSVLGTADQTSQRMLAIHKAYRDHPQVDERQAASLFADILSNLGYGPDPSFGDVLGWVGDVQSMADPVRHDGPQGYVYQAGVYATLAQQGDLVHIKKSEAYTSLDGTRTFVVQSARYSPQGAIVMETKSGPYTNGDFERMYEAADFVELGGPTRGYAKVLEFRTETGYTPQFEEEAALVAQAFHIRIVLYDATGAVVGDYS